MVNFKLLSLAYLATNALFACAQEQASAADEQAAAQQEAPAQLNVLASTHFPDSELGIKLVNGKTLNAEITVSNQEAEEAVFLTLVTGQLSDLETGASVRNLTATRHGAEIAAGQQATVKYPISLDMNPHDLRLQLVAFVATAKQTIYTLKAFDGQVSIVEAPISIFDPQILFLYIFLGSLFAGTLYFFYTVWVVPYLPVKRKTPVQHKSQAAEKSEAAHATGAESPSSPTINTEWIPAHHIQRPEAKRVKNTGRKTRG